jgi:hypothetical protein
MANIAKLSVSLEADISKFQKGMEKSSSLLSAFNINMASLAGKAVDAFVAIGVGAVAGLGALVTNSINAVTTQTRLADRLQISTEALAGFQLASKKVGVDAESANTFLTHMTKAFGEAEGGSEEAQATFKALGIDLVSFAGQSSDQKLKTIAEGFKNIADAGTRVDLAMKIGGKSGAELVGVLAGGADSIQASTDEALKFGTALSRLDSAKVMEAHSSFERIVKTFDGLITQLTVQLSPFISHIAKQFAEWAESGTGNVNRVKNGFDEFLDVLAEIANIYHLLDPAQA